MPGYAIGLEQRMAPACSFAPRCPSVHNECTDAAPMLALVDHEPDHAVRCFHPVASALVRAVAPAGMGTPTSDQIVLDVQAMTITHTVGGRSIPTVKGASFAVREGECVALLGQSGSGKSTIARGLAGLQRYGGTVTLDGNDLEPLARRRSPAQHRAIQLIFQDPATALNPRENIEVAIRRGIGRGSVSRKNVSAEVGRLLELVRLPSQVRTRLPRELSGGERQRVCIARALASKPTLLLCDEITSALDVSVQAAVVNLVRDLQDELKMAVLFITHDIGVVSTIADRVLVLEEGLICESGLTREVLDNPAEDYTKRLMSAVPTLPIAVS
jgi:peptide/nickel transport system ATP-binding protein